jgi:hypothetical protein
MCKEMPVIPVNKLVDPQRIIKKWRTNEEERHKGLLTPPPKKEEFVKKSPKCSQNHSLS